MVPARKKNKWQEVCTGSPNGRQLVGRLQGGSCSNDDGGNVLALAAARLGDGLHEESMRVCARDGGWRTTQ